ncbi:ATP-dependent RecD-like DNA helicase [Alphaproteobacteria bacterium]|nr:ATP-dependent RecD-like DNA helicase [Alphaproteobacteria bacterium]
MKAETEKQTLVKLKGQLERVTFENEENAYTVAKIKVYGYSDLVTIVGNIPSPTPGEILSLSGEWIEHPKFGEQFKVVFCSCEVPSSVDGIEKYLGSGLIKGIGRKMARRIVKKFGERTLDIIEESADKLLEIEGIGEYRIDMIKAAWSEQKEIRSVMVFLQSHGVSSAYATKIYKRYGNESIAVVKKNPYRLAHDIVGIGFLTADKIARKLGFDEKSPLRAAAGIMFVLHELTDKGDVYTPYEELLSKSEDMLKVDESVLEIAMKSLLAEKKIVIENLQQEGQDNLTLDQLMVSPLIDGYASALFDVEDGSAEENASGATTEAENESNVTLAVYLSGYHLAEVQIAEKLKEIRDLPKNTKKIRIDEALKQAQKKLSISLANKQIEAVKAAITNKFLVITGGPGTGKTTITKSILEIMSKVTDKILLAAPTGRAAKRMSEASSREAKTIHRLLEVDPINRGFKRNEDNPLDCDLIILDEASMIDTLLMHHLLKAVPKHATMILVGDINQLPSVGAGNVLKDIIDSNAFSVVELNEIFRQAQESHIIVNSHRIINGQYPILDNAGNTDFYFMEEEDQDKVLDKILLMVQERIPKKFGYDPINDIQVLTPMNRGIVGTAKINESLQEAINPDGFEIIRGGRRYREGDKIMQIRNNYDKNVFNGDIGFISNIDPEEQSVTAVIDGKDVVYDYSELDELVLAYAVSIHKSQGSEYPVVVMPLVMSHYIMLQRNLLYTGITRGKELVIVIGSKKAMSISINNNKTMKRNTWLKERLM